jgi:hypothetical protein
MEQQPLPIQERIKTYEDACAALNRQPVTEEQFSFLPEKDRKAMFSLHKITTVVEALNEGWNPDWNDYNEYKYYPWFDMETYDDAPAGSGFSFVDFVYGASDSYVGARLVLKTRELAEYVGKQFLEDYKNWFKK